MSDLDLGGILGTVIVAGVAMNVADRMMGSPRQGRSTTTTTTYRKGKKTVKKTTTGRIGNHPGNFSNVLPRW